MKIFLKNHKKLFIIILALTVACILTTTSLTGVNTYYNSDVDNISTCSTPEGRIVAKGIDISSYQEDVDFSKVKSAGYDFVIMRAGTGLGKDKNFELYYEQATQANLDIGCYFYSYAKNVKETKLEAGNLLKYIRGKTFTYPVFYDFEYSKLLSYDRIDINTRMINNFCKIIKRSGYYPGVYTSSSFYTNFMDTQTIGDNWDVWIANYGDYSGNYNHQNFSKMFSMWQYTDKGTVDGISTNVDMNLCFVDYPSVINQFNKRLAEI